MIRSNLIQHKLINIMSVIVIILVAYKMMVLPQSKEFYNFIYLRYSLSILFFPLLYLHAINREVYLNHYIRIRDINNRKKYFLYECKLTVLYATILSTIIWLVAFLGTPYVVNIYIFIKLMIYTVELYIILMMCVNILHLLVSSLKAYFLICMSCFILNCFDLIFPFFKISPLVIFQIDSFYMEYLMCFMIGSFVLMVILFVSNYVLYKKVGDRDE